VPGTSIRFRVRIDGQPPGAAHGTDVDGQGNGTVTFPDPGIQAYAFTFG
jgi:hypothetical protein